MKNNFTKLLIAAVVSIFILVMLFTGCTTKGAVETTAAATEAAATTAAATTAAATTAAPAGAVAINVPTMLGWVTTNGIIPPITEALAKEGITVNKVEVEGITLKERQMLAATTKDGSFDVYLAWDALIPSFTTDYIEPLDQYLIDAGVDLEAFKASLYPNVLDQITIDGKIYWMPIHVNTMLGYARTDLFTNADEQAAYKAQYGADLPQPDAKGSIKIESWDQLWQIAKFFTRDTNKDGETDLWGYIPAGARNHGGCYFEEMIFRSGFGIFDADGHSSWGPAHPENQAKVEEIATQLQKGVKDKISSPGIVDMDMTQVNETYKEGKAAMTFTWNVDFWGEDIKPEVTKNLGNSKPSSWSIGFVNTAPENKGLMSIIGYALSKDCKNKEAAVKFLLKCYDPVLRKMVHETVGLPCPNGVMSLTDELLAEGLVPGAYKDAIKQVGTFWPTSPPFPETETARDIYRGDALERLETDMNYTPAQFVKDTGDGIEALMKEAGYF